MDRLIIAAFPRTASTFLADALQVAFPHLEILHTFHKIEILRKENPIITILRKPEDAISSWLTKVNETDIEGHLDWYNRFILAALDRQGEIFITTFDEITSDVNSVIDKCADFYSLGTPVKVDAQAIKRSGTSNPDLRQQVLESPKYAKSLHLYEQVLNAA